MDRESPSDPVRAWEHYAADVAPRRSVNAAGARTWFNWTQYPDHGPDETVLGDVRGRTVLELGSGGGANLAHLAMLGANCIGVDLAPSREMVARRMWGHIPNVDFQTADAIEFLTAAPCSFDVVYSVFGATWFCDPDELIQVVRTRLNHGGVFAFSHMPPKAAGTRRAITTGAANAVTRQDHPGAWWTQRLVNAGFPAVEDRVIPAPAPGKPGTLLVRAIAA